VVEKCPIPRHFVVVVIVSWWVENDRTFPFFERILQLLSAEHITNNAFGEEDETWVDFVIGMGNID